METALIAAQILSTCLIAGWLSLGVLDNIVHPSVNETYTAQVMEMTRMKADYPDAYAMVAHRAVTNRSVQVLAFRLVVLGELCATALLWAGAGAMLFGAGAVLALWGAMAFTAIWGGFLIIGNYFCYWLSHEGAQNTHFQMTLWGVGTMILLVQ